MAKTAIILGATGAVGKEVLTLLEKDSRYSTIKLFLRHSTGSKSPKVQEHIIDLFELEKHENAFKGDEVYCCIGTTKAQTPDTETYRKIDYGIPAMAAKLAAKNGIPTFIAISALGADTKSRIFYNRTKGEMQEAVIGEAISKTHLLQPALIVAVRKNTRVMEKAAAGFMWLINPLLAGAAARYKSIKATVIAKAMVWLANNNYNTVIIPSEKIRQLGGKD